MRRSSPVLPTTSRSPGSCTRSSPRRNLAAPTPPASATSMAFPRSGPGAALRIAPPAAGNRRAAGRGEGPQGAGGAVVGGTFPSAVRSSDPAWSLPLPGSPSPVSGVTVSVVGGLVLVGGSVGGGLVVCGPEVGGLVGGGLVVCGPEVGGGLVSDGAVLGGLSSVVGVRVPLVGTASRPGGGSTSWDCWTAAWTAWRV